MINQQGLTMEDAIRQFRDEFLEAYAYEDCQTYQDINNGYCEHFADGFVFSYREVFGDDLTSFANLEFCLEDEDLSWKWDVDLLETRWPNIKPPYGLTWEETQLFAEYYHCFLSYQGRFYDAECPEGVENFFELPNFERMAYQYAHYCKPQAKTLQEAQDLFLNGNIA